MGRETSEVCQTSEVFTDVAVRCERIEAARLFYIRPDLTPAPLLEGEGRRRPGQEQAAPFFEPRQRSQQRKMNLAFQPRRISGMTGKS